MTFTAFASYVQEYIDASDIDYDNIDMEILRPVLAEAINDAFSTDIYDASHPWVISLAGLITEVSGN